MTVWIKTFKRDFYVGLYRAKFRYAAFMIVAVLIFSIYIYIMKDAENISLELVSPIKDKNFIQTNIFFIFLIVGGYFVNKRVVYDDLFKMNWMIFIRYKNLVKIIISKIMYLLVINIVLYQFLAFIMNVIVFFILNDIVFFGDIFYNMYIISLSVISIGLFGILLDMYFSETISFLFSIVVVLINLYTQNGYFIGAITNIIFYGESNFDTRIFVWQIVLVFIISAGSIYAYGKKDII